MAIELPPETQKLLIESVKRFFEEQMEEEIGDLRAMLLLDFVVREIGPSIYNQAIVDARAYLEKRVAELDAACYEPEFGYWQK